MSDQKRSYFNPDQHRAYLGRTRAKSDALKREKDGELVAENLESLWTDLEEVEKAFLQAMVAIDQRSIIALHDHPALRGLISMGLLTYPQGHGGNWMRAARTSYAIPPAVWGKLRSRNAQYPDAMEPKEARNLLDEIISADVIGPSRK